MSYLCSCVVYEDGRMKIFRAKNKCWAIQLSILPRYFRHSSYLNDSVILLLPLSYFIHVDWSIAVFHSLESTFQRFYSYTTPFFKGLLSFVLVESLSVVSVMLCFQAAIISGYVSNWPEILTKIPISDCYREPWC